MKSKSTSVALTLLSVVALCGCGARTPTEPSVFTDSYVAVSAHIRNADGTPTILRCQGHLDGLPLSQAQSFPSPVSQAELGGTLLTLAPGLHTLSIHLLDQTVSPSPYVLFDLRVAHVVVAPGGVTTPEISFYGFQTPGTLATGDSISVTFGVR
jgi:hypothetical protein